MGKRRRAKGEGSLEKLSDGRWRVRINVDTSRGKRRKAFVAKTKSEVIKRRDDYLGRGPQIASTLPLASYLDRWLEDHVREQRRPSTHKEYESACRNHVVPEIGRVPMGELRAMHVQGLLTTLRAKGLKESTVHRVYAIVGAAMRQAVKWQVLSLDPMSGVDAPKPPKKGRTGFLTSEQVGQLFRAAKNWRDGRLYPVMAMSVLTGMRQGEMCALRWRDVDLGAGTIHVNETLHRKAGGWEYGPTKSGKSRVLEIDERTAAFLRYHRQRQREEKMASPSWEETDHVFTTLEGKPLHRAVLYQSFTRLLRREGLPKITFHELRHTCATLLGQTGAHPATVQAILGHANIKTTLDTYTHLWPGASRDAHGRLGDAVFGSFGSDFEGESEDKGSEGVQKPTSGYENGA
jgi:integrase